MQVVSMKDQMIKQHNAITTARYEMTAAEKNIVYMLLAQLEDDDAIEKTYLVSMQELQAKLGQEVDSAQFKEATEKLISRAYIMEEAGGDFLQVSLLASARYRKDSDMVELELSQSIRPYLFQLKNNFTAFQLHMALSLKSKFSKRMYEMLSQHKDVGTMKIAVEALKYRLGLINPSTKEEQYKAWSLFAAQVLEVAKRELEACTDIAFRYRVIKTGRKFTDLEFQISSQAVQTLPRRAGVVGYSTKQ